MLRYLGVGQRQFGMHPLKPIVRMNWEFFAVLKGRTAPLARDNTHPPTVEKTIWVSAPGSVHTWAGEGTRRVHVAVFHFGAVPAALEAHVRERGQASFPLTAADCRRIAELATQLQPEFERPSNYSHLVFQGVLIELTLLVLRKLPQGKRPLAASDAEAAIDAATAWFAENVRANPSIIEVAHEVHVSPSTLRRLFRRVLRESPARVFRRIQIEKGMRLLTETKSKLDSIADECGFTCTSDFCRAFKAFTRVTPTTWRQTVLTPPRAAEVARRS
jgi:AraC-like DNA-binding protein